MADDKGFGQPDIDALNRIRKRFERHEPLVSEYSFDSPNSPTTLSVTLSDGFHGSGRFDIRWSRRGYYSFHYREQNADLDFRFDRHPNPHSPEKHFHPPPDAARADAERSCIGVELPDLVALAVLKAWRHGYETGNV